MNEASTGWTAESFVMNLVYTGRNGSARAFVEEMEESGLNLWDTAYAYGMGASERVLGTFLEGLPREVSRLG